MPAETTGAAATTGAGDGNGGALDLGSTRRIHVVGIGGAGMSAIASVLRAMGHTVSGSDLKDSPVAQRLRSHGITVVVGHRPENVAGADAVTFSPAVQAENLELTEARARGIRVVPRSEMLAAICATRQCLAVAGTHGKTTTASMLSLILVEAGLRPSFVIGADVNEIGTNAVWDTGEWLVVEADESYGTFQAIRPDLAVLTNVEPDHLDYYGSFTALRDAFSDYLAGAGRGTIVCADDPEAAAIGATHGAITVGTAEGSTYRMGDIELQRSSVSFTLRGPEGDMGTLHLGVPGLHNARNGAVAAVAALAGRRAVRRGPGCARPLRRGHPPLRVPRRIPRRDLRGRLRTPARPRCAPPWRRRGAAAGPASSPCSSPTASRGPPHWPKPSELPSPTRTSWSSPTSTAPANDPSPGSRGAWWPTPYGRRTRDCP